MGNSAVHQEGIEAFLAKLQGDEDAGEPQLSSQVVLGKRKATAESKSMPPAKSMKTTNASGEATFDLTGMRQVHATLLRSTATHLTVWTANTILSATYWLSIG